MLNEDLVKIVEEAIKKNWERPCFSNYGSSVTFAFGQVGARIKKLHELFSCFGVEKGDKISLCGKNSANWATLYLAAISYGAVIVPILNDFSADEIHHVVNHSDSKLFFASEQIYDKIEESVFGEIKALFSLEDFSVFYIKEKRYEPLCAEIIKHFKENLTLAKEDYFFEIPEKGSIATIVYTSGTTGFSKGVMISHNCLMANIRFAIDNLPISVDESLLSFLPLAHSLGCAFDFLSQFLRGVHLIFFNKVPTPKALLKAFGEIRPFLVIAVPLILEKIYRSKIQPLLETKKMRILMKIPVINNIIYKKIGRELSRSFGGNFYEIVAGGAAFNPEIEKFLLKAGVKFTSGYGMTECAPLIAYTDYADGRKLGSCGKIMSYLTAKIDKPDEKGVGEICVKGENVTSGYYKMEETTAEAFDGEGWFHTGDLGYIDADGFLFISGRLKNMILSSSGQNIYPEEIESRLNYMPFVLESLVLDSGKDKLTAFVYPDKARMIKENVDDASLVEIMNENKRLINEKLPSYAKISEIRIYPEEFEKTSTKKIKRRLYLSLVNPEKQRG